MAPFCKLSGIGQVLHSGESAVEIDEGQAQSLPWSMGEVATSSPNQGVEGMIMAHGVIILPKHVSPN